MSDDFQRGLQARLAHLIGEASQWSRGSGAHPPGLVKALNEAFEYGCAEIERLRDLIRTHDEPSDVYRQELENIAHAKRFDRKRFDDDTSFADWAQSRARHALARTQVARTRTTTNCEAVQRALLRTRDEHDDPTEFIPASQTRDGLCNHGFVRGECIVSTCEHR